MSWNFNNLTRNPYERGAIILSSGAGIFLVLYGLKFFLPALGEAIGLALGTAVGSTVATVAWATNIASIGIAAAGGVTVLLVFKTIIKEAKEKPYSWALPVLSLFGPFVLDICKDFYPDKEGVGKALINFLFALFYLVGGIIWNQKKVICYFVGGFWFSLPIILATLKYCHDSNKTITQAIHAIPSGTVVSIIFLLIMAIMVAALSFVLRDKKEI